jgi:cytoskeletal protein CcmA (bactofilin family)
MIGKLKVVGGKSPEGFDKTSELNAFIGEGTEFEGKLSFVGTVRVEGKLTGEIYAKDILIVGDNGFVEGEIDVNTIIITGTVTGNIKANTKVELSYPGKFYGTIETPNFILNEGAIFEGDCKMEKIKTNLEQSKFSTARKDTNHDLIKVVGKKGNGGTKPAESQR